MKVDNDGGYIMPEDEPEDELPETVPVESTTTMLLDHINGLFTRLESSRAECNKLHTQVARLERELLKWQRSAPFEDGPPKPAQHLEAKVSE